MTTDGARADLRAALRRARMRAALVDEVLVLVVAFLVAAMAMQTGVLPVLAVPVGRLVAPLAATLELSVTALTVAAMAVLGWSLIRTLYRVLGSGSPSGQTPGKRLAGVRVVGGHDGMPPGYRRAVVRELVVLLETLTLVGLAGAALTHPWHDRVGGTRTELIDANPSR